MEISSEILQTEKFGFSVKSVIGFVVLFVMRLKTDRGLPALPKLFKDVQFAGRGHEVSRTLELTLIFTVLLSAIRSDRRLL